MQYKAPEITESSAQGDCKTTSNHDAFGMIGMSIVTGGDGVLFGSDLNHSQQVRIRIARARLDRAHSSDHFHADSTMVEVTMSHTQFAEMITSPNRGDGVPCTINYAPERDASIKAMPGIIKAVTKAEILRGEIKSSAQVQLAKVNEQLAKIEKMLADGNLNKKALKEAVFNMKCHVENTPSNMEYILRQAEKTLEKAVSSAKIDVECYINSAINKLGIDTARSLGLTTNAASGFLTNDVIEN